MLNALETLLDIFVVLGTSKWGWIGLAAALGSSYLVWRVAEGHETQPIAAGLSFVVVFMAFAWQELKGK